MLILFPEYNFLSAQFYRMYYSLQIQEASDIIFHIFFLSCFLMCHFFQMSVDLRMIIMSIISI